MTTLYLHIGQHKTGTTTIQHFCIANKHVLNTLGYDYDGPLGHHHKFAAELLQDKTSLLDDYLLRMSKSQIQNHIISSEEFSKCSVHQIKMLGKSILKVGIDFKIIIYIRKQDKAIESIYTQMLKTGKIRISIHEFIRVNKLKRLHYGSFIDQWTNELGIERIKVVNYEEAKLDLISSFLECLNYVPDKSIVKFFKAKRKNKRPTKIQLVRMLKEQKINMSLSSTEPADSTTYSLLNSEDIRMLNRRFMDQNKYVAEKYFGRDKLF